MLNLCVWLWAGLSVSYENKSVIGAHLQRVATSCCRYSLRFVFMSRVVTSINTGCQTKMLNAISREAGCACALRSTYIEVCTAALIMWRLQVLQVRLLFARYWNSSVLKGSASTLGLWDG